MDLKQRIYEVLRKHWGYEAFRSVQEEVILSVLRGQDTLALMPTGGGKSLTYQVPALVQEGLCIVVTPLIALMKDQVDRLRRMGINAVAIHSGLTKRQIEIALDNCCFGDVKLLYIAPERLATELFRTRVQRMQVSLLAVDEAHCISQWGYDFRPHYLRIGALRNLLGDVPVLALTASATELVRRDIMEHLHFTEGRVICSSFARPNLSYSIRHTEEKEEQILRVLRNVEGSGIIYMRTREGCEQLAAKLCDEGVAAAAYHAGLAHHERSERQEAWVKNEVRVMVATNAFGMGIDKADVRFVIHYAPCDALENYYQEAGRAGRDGKRAYALLLVGADDERRTIDTLDREFPPLERVKEIYERICNYLQLPLGDGKGVSYAFDLYEFCAREHLYEGLVSSAIKLLQLNGYLTLTDAREHPARLLFTVSRDDLYKLRLRHEDIDPFLRTLLRLYNALFTDFQPIDEQEIAHHSGYTVERVHELLKRLWQLRVIRYIPSNAKPLLTLHEERLPLASLYIAPDTYLRRKALMHERFEEMQRYIANEERCRSRLLEEHFGKVDERPCGICDLCLARRRRERAAAETTTQAADGKKCE